MENIFLVLENADLIEARGPWIPRLAFRRGDQAEEYLASKGDMRPFWKILEILMFESVHHAMEAHKEEVRQKALGKLSYEEKKALGLA